jgi:hypothetical protein
MVRSFIRFPLCLLIGLSTGSILGVLFVPNPTGVVAFVLGIVCTVLITWSLYQSEWLREETEAPSAQN